MSGRREWIGVGLVGHVTTSQRQVLPSSYVVDAQLMQSARAGLSLTSVDFFFHAPAHFTIAALGLGSHSQFSYFLTERNEMMHRG